jgi:hypothetical protein
VKKRRDNLPTWDETYVNALLDELKAQRDKLPDEVYEQLQLTDPLFAAAVERDFTQRLKAGRYRVAMEEAARFAPNQNIAKRLLKIVATRPPGRRSGEARETDWPPELKARCERALEDREHVHECWRKAYGSRRLRVKRTLDGILEDRHNLASGTLEKYLANRKRNLRPKNPNI